MLSIITFRNVNSTAVRTQFDLMLSLGALFALYLRSQLNKYRVQFIQIFGEYIYRGVMHFA